MASPPRSVDSALRNLGLRLRELRRQRGMTQQEVAEALDIEAPNYARIEQGRQNATVATLVPIARLFGVGLDDLFKTARDRVVRPGRPRGS